jgi:hypothetical protein
MLMLNGEVCGANGNREVKIKFICDSELDNLDVRVEEITEPKTCKYEIKLLTPLVCDQFSMNVYPNLNQTLKSEWDLLYSELHNDIITEKVFKTFFSKTRQVIV